MVEALLDGLSWALIPMGLLPVIVAIVLLPSVNSPVVALKERARMQLLLALLGAIVAVLAVNRVFNFGFDLGWVLVGFVAILLAIDVASGVWLWLYLTGRFRH